MVAAASSLSITTTLTNLQIANPPVAALYEDALVYETGSAITSTGALSAYSGAKTGRSPSDKRIVKEETSDKDVWWGPVNKPMTVEVRLTLLCVSSPSMSAPDFAMPGPLRNATIDAAPARREDLVESLCSSSVRSVQPQSTTPHLGGLTSV